MSIHNQKNDCKNHSLNKITFSQTSLLLGRFHGFIVYLLPVLNSDEQIEFEAENHLQQIRRKVPCHNI